MNTAEENRAYVRYKMSRREPDMYRALNIAVAVIDIQEDQVVGFGDLDFEHGATGPRLGSDEVL